jgi:hypothetical protein
MRFQTIGRKLIFLLFLKKGDRSNVENYRTVSLTPFYGKVFEKMIKI